MLKFGTILPINGVKYLRAMENFDVPLAKNCAQFLKKAIVEQKIVRNDSRILIAEHKNCAHLSTVPIQTLLIYLIYPNVQY